MTQNILSGFIGALIALTLSAIYSRVTNAIRLNEIRITIMGYLNVLALPKLERYILDSQKAITDVQKAILTNKDKEYPYDQMPILTSEIIKSFSQSDLRKISYDMDVYTHLIDFYYSVEFLKENMPSKIYNDYVHWVNNHLKIKNLQPGDEQITHIQTCLSIDRERQDAIRNFKMKISTAEGLSTNIKTVFKKIEGSSYKWILKYSVH